MNQAQVEHDRAVAIKAWDELLMTCRMPGFNPHNPYLTIAKTVYLDREYPLPCKECGGKIEVPEDVKKWAHGTVTCDVQEMSLARAANAARFILSLAEGAK